MSKGIKESVLLMMICSLLIAGCSSSATPASQTASMEDTVVEDTSDIDVPSETDLVEDAIVAYAALLNGEIEDLSDNILTGEYDVRYALIHLDDDEIPELALPLGNAHPEGVAFYTYDGQNVNRIFAAGSFGEAAYEKNSGIIYGQYSGMGSIYTTVGVFKYGEVQEEVRVQVTDIALATGEERPDGASEFYYGTWSTDETAMETGEITKEEYDALLEEYLPGKRKYRILRYEDLPRVADATDLRAELRASLEREDDIEQIGSDYFVSFDEEEKEMVTDVEAWSNIPEVSIEDPDAEKLKDLLRHSVSSKMESTDDSFIYTYDYRDVNAGEYNILEWLMHNGDLVRSYTEFERADEVERVEIDPRHLYEGYPIIMKYPKEIIDTLAEKLYNCTPEMAQFYGESEVVDETNNVLSYYLEDGYYYKEFYGLGGGGEIFADISKTRYDGVYYYIVYRAYHESSSPEKENDSFAIVKWNDGYWTLLYRYTEAEKYRF